MTDNAEADLVPSADTDFLETSDANHKVETRPVPVTGASLSSSPAIGTTYGAGETMTVSLAMREAVRVTGRPYIWLDVGGVRRRANYAGPIGESTAALEISYTVQAGDRDADGVALCASGPGCRAIQLNGGSIRGVGDGVDANLALPKMEPQADHKVDAAEAVTTTPPNTSTACTAEVKVPHDWALIPSGVAAGGKFRLLFVSSGTRNASSTNIADYNSFVQGRAAAGHDAIQPFSAGFRVLGSTETVDARDNTCTTGAGVGIHWLNGSKIADNNADFYDGSWSNQTAGRNESGNTRASTRVWTGSNADGAKAGLFLGFFGQQVTNFQFHSVYGEPFVAASGAIFQGSVSRSNNYALYGVSQVFTVRAPSATVISITSSPVIGDTYHLGETIEFEVTYSDAVDVRGTPKIGLADVDARPEFPGRVRGGLCARVGHEQAGLRLGRERSGEG